ncbi:MAG TPA: hypothetical protein VNV41_03980 [Candidatus Acidoferrales bacterium]|jgi:hypothetical protein|nr:hypothetical protein [Candidatus Acidoferrales bacterium]
MSPVGISLLIPLAQGDSRKGETNAKEDFLKHDSRRVSDDDRGQEALAICNLGGFGLIAWLGGIVVVSIIMFGSTSDRPPVWLGVIAVVAMLAMCGWILHIWLWRAFGKEVVTVGNGSLSLGKNVLDFDRFAAFADLTSHKCRTSSRVGYLDLSTDSPAC